MRFLAILLLLTGCVSRTVILQNPQGHTAQCKVDPWGDFDRTRQIENCVKAHERAGYKVVGDSN